MELSIVIPAYNEENRLSRTLEGLFEDIQSGRLNSINIQEIIVVDDGSKDKTIEVAQAFQRKLKQLKVLPTPQNRGKGHAVRSGLIAAQSPWGLVADADMSTPWVEMLKLKKYSESHGAQIAIASRDLPDSLVTHHQSWIREHMGKTFNLIVRMMTGLSFKDTQCGFKLISLTHSRDHLPRLQVNRFAWDVELLMVAQHHNLKIVEVPIKWEHRDESRVHPVRDAADMGMTVARLRLQKMLGAGPFG